MFVVKYKYLKIRLRIYSQKEGFTVGDPQSAVMSGFLIGDLKAKATATVPEQCRLSFWKRYVDNILERVAAGHTQELTDHLNSTDNTGNIKFTYEEETDKSMAFVDM